MSNVKYRKLSDILFIAYMERGYGRSTIWAHGSTPSEAIGAVMIKEGNYVIDEEAQEAKEAKIQAEYLVKLDAEKAAKSAELEANIPL